MRDFLNALKRPAALLLAVLFITGCGKSEPQQQLLSISGMTMGTTYSIRWVEGANTPQASRLQAAVNAELQAINRSMSTYIDDSELSLLNRHPVNQWYPVSGRLLDVLQQAATISEQSEGLFDSTVGPLVNLWGFGPDGRIETAPSAAEIQQLRPRIGYQLLEIDPAEKRVRRLANIYVDLSAIAKGYGVDIIAGLLEQQGIHNYLVEIGGEMRLSGSKPEQQPWRVAIERPDVAGRSVQEVVKPGTHAVATSGDYRNYFEQDGIRFSHTINPHTGKPITHKLASVTVISDSCAQADAYATALTVMGEEKGYAFATAQGIEAYFIVKTADGFRVRMTPGFNQFIDSQE
ncbi:MAG: FAD:protein FMN transferase [Marinobacterium sp.]|nr:FAD:protein FMN transferase [Marinobacterium sp.]